MLQFSQYTTPWRSCCYCLIKLSFDSVSIACRSQHILRASVRAMRQSHAPSRELLRISTQTLYWQKLESFGYIIILVYLHSHFPGGLRKRTHFETVRNGRSRSSKVVGTNWKHVWGFLSVINRNLGPNLPSDPTPIPSEFWGVPLALDCRCCGSEERRP